MLSASPSTPIPGIAEAGEREVDEARRVLTRILVAANRQRRSEITSAEFQEYAMGLLLALSIPATLDNTAVQGMSARHALGRYAARLKRADQAIAQMMEQSDAEIIADAIKTMRADDIRSAIRAWLDADDATHWGAFETALDAVVQGVNEREAAVAMLRADADTMRSNADAYSEEAPTDARALHEVAATLVFKAAQIERGDHLATLTAKTEKAE